jgi:hypothetical protein
VDSDYVGVCFVLQKVGWPDHCSVSGQYDVTHQTSPDLKLRTMTAVLSVHYH